MGWYHPKDDYSMTSVLAKQSVFAGSQKRHVIIH